MGRPTSALALFLVLLANVVIVGVSTFMFLDARVLK